MNEIEKRKEQIIKHAREIFHSRKTGEGIKHVVKLMDAVELLEECEKNHGKS